MTKVFKINIVFILALLLIACNDSIKYPDGGYDYPKHVADKDTNFYYYPVKDIMPKRDSLLYASTYLSFKEFNEPNLSLKSLGHDAFRLQYSFAQGGFYIITVTKNSIQIKKEIIGDERLFDENRLSPYEQNIYRLITYHYPYNNLNKYLNKYVDSIKTINPAVLAPEYYLWLTKKTFKPIDPKKIYTITTIKITDKDFKHLVEIINNSSYWKMPYSIKCEYPPNDGWGYGLEANTKYKYNFVTASSCSDSTKQIINFAKACQEIVNYAHMKKDIFIWSDSMYQIKTYDIPLPDIKQSTQKHKGKIKASKHK